MNPRQNLVKVAVVASVMGCRGILGLRDDYVLDEVDGALSDAATDTNVADVVDGGPSVDGPIDADGGCSVFDAASDPRNCGRCGHDCLGGACKFGVCQPFVIAHEVNLLNVASDGTDVFFANSAVNGVVERCSRSGCGDAAASVIASGELNPVVMTTDGTYVYYAVQSVDGGLKSIVKGMTDASAVLSSGGLPNTPSTVFGDGTYLYFDNANAAIWRCTQPSCAGLMSIVSTVVMQHFAVDSARVYWTSSYNSIWACDKTNCEATKDVIASNLQGTYDIAVYGPDVFFMTDEGGSPGAGKLWTCPANANSMMPCTPKVLATGLDKPVYGIKADQAGVYFAVRGTAAKNYADGKILFCKAGGCGSTPTLLADNQFNLTAFLSSDSDALFWTAVDPSNAVWGVAKP